MDIIKDKIDEIMVRIGYTCQEKHSDKQLNSLLEYWFFFDEKEVEIQGFLGVSLETILYSKYYWCTKYKKRFNELYGKDVGIEQQQYKIIEEMTQRIKEVDWNLIQMIEENVISE